MTTTLDQAIKVFLTDINGALDTLQSRFKLIRSFDLTRPLSGGIADANTPDGMARKAAAQILKAEAHYSQACLKALADKDTEAVQIIEARDAGDAVILMAVRVFRNIVGSHVLTNAPTKQLLKRAKQI